MPRAMKSIFKGLPLWALLLGSAVSTHAQGLGVCGDPPPVANETLKGEIKGKAQLLSKYIGDAELSGKIETSRTEIFSKYPDSELSRSNSYFEYQVCVLIMSDKSKSNAQKLEALKEVRREFSKPIVKKVDVIIRVGGPFVDNRRFGPVDGELSTVAISVDGESVINADLSKAFGSHKLQLEIGDHVVEFKAKVYGDGSNHAILEDNCHSTFTVTGSGTFEPRIKIQRTDEEDLDGSIADCSLNKK
jgi:hypothetical protein